MDSPAEQHVAPTEQPSAPGSLNGGGQNEADNIGLGNPPATVSEALAALESDEHPRGDEIRKQVGFRLYGPLLLFQSDICRWNTTFPTRTWLPTSTSWPSVVAR
jgi:hypothetical protein